MKERKKEREKMTFLSFCGRMCYWIYRPGKLCHRYQNSETYPAVTTCSWRSVRDLCWRTARSALRISAIATENKLR